MKGKMKISRTTQWRVKKGLSPGIGRKYHQKKYYPGELRDVENTLRIAKVIFLKHFLDWRNHEDDLRQEAVLRCLELAGKSQDPNFQFYVCRNAMRDYIARWLKGGEKYSINEGNI